MSRRSMSESLFNKIAIVIILGGVTLCWFSPLVTHSEPAGNIAKPSIPVQDKSERLLGLHMTLGSVGFDKAYSVIKATGTTMLELPLNWDEYETSPNTFTQSWLPDANRAFPKDGFKIGLTANPIDTNVLRLPQDLRGKRFSDPQVIDRYKKFIDFIAKALPDAEIIYFSIGNEINAYLLDSADKWNDYTKFFNAVAPYARKVFPHAVVSSKMIYSNLMKDPQRVRGIINNSDAVLVTYYPLADGMSRASEPMAVHQDFNRIVKYYPDKKIYFTEVGYPSGKANGSSEAKQAKFVHEVFLAWDENMSRIPLINFFWLHDISKDDMVKAQKYYNSYDPGIASFFGTIGLCTYDGKNKPSFIRFSDEAKKRGW